MARIESITIQNYRCFREFSAHGFSRANLFVGRNNSGKTALLEAIEAAALGGTPLAFYRASIERGEIRPHRGSEDLDAVAVDVRRWFSGHRLEAGAGLMVSWTGAGATSTRRNIVAGANGLELSSNDSPRSLPLSSDGFVGAGSMSLILESGLRRTPPVAFVGTRRLTVSELVPIWQRIVLTPAEDDIVKAMQTLDPAVQRIAVTGANGDAVARVLLVNSPEPVPLGSLGEGATRMLTLATALTSARGGTLLIDEVESGLHYSVHRDLWTLLIKTARALDVQLFATTHSRDCLEGIARLHEQSPELANELTLFRLEAGAREPVRMSVEGLSRNLESQIDVR